MAKISFRSSSLRSRRRTAALWESRRSCVGATQALSFWRPDASSTSPNRCVSCPRSTRSPCSTHRQAGPPSGRHQERRKPRRRHHRRGGRDREQARLPAEAGCDSFRALTSLTPFRPRICARFFWRGATIPITVGACRCRARQPAGRPDGRGCPAPEGCTCQTSRPPTYSNHRI